MRDVPLLRRNCGFDSPVARLAALGATLVALAPAATFAQTNAPSPVGLKQLEYLAEGNRHLALTMFYPAAVRDRSAARFVMPFFTNLELYKDAEPAFNGVKRPLVMFSHGRGSNGLYYAWFAEFLAARGYVVAALNHYRANTYDSTIAYLANKLWQRPRDISLTISLLIRDPFWGGLIDERRIGVAGHSQGGFTALWVAGAKINPEKYLAFQRGWRNNQMVPDYLRSELPLDAREALDVHDERVKAAFAMAPGIVQAFGMDEAGLRQLKVPAYIRSAQPMPRHHPPTTPLLPPDTPSARSFTSSLAASTTTSSSTSAASPAGMNSHRPASTRPASIAAASMRRSARRRCDSSMRA